MRIAERVYLIGSGASGCSLSHRSDCNVYAFDCGEGFLLIDSGCGAGTERLFEIAADDGIVPDAVEALLLTHGHLDHSGGAFYANQLGIPVWCSEETALALEAGDEAAISLAEAKQAGIYGPEFKLRSCPVERRFHGGEAFRIGAVHLKTMRTPGHSRDSLSYLFDTPEGLTVFSGDLVFHGGKVLISGTWDCDPRAYAKSLRALAELPVEGLYPGHAIWSVHAGKDHLGAALKYLDRLVLPPNIL